MAFQNSGQSGSQPVASTQLAQQYRVDSSVANYIDLIPVILTRGAPRLLICATQTAGVEPATLTVQASVANQTEVGQTAYNFVQVGSLVLTPLNAPVAVERAIPTKFIRVLVEKPAANDVLVIVTVMAAQ
jgi:hypothetical protein